MSEGLLQAKFETKPDGYTVVCETETKNFEGRRPQKKVLCSPAAVRREYNMYENKKHLIVAINKDVIMSGQNSSLKKEGFLQPCARLENVKREKGIGHANKLLHGYNKLLSIMPT